MGLGEMNLQPSLAGLMANRLSDEGFADTRWLPPFMEGATALVHDVLEDADYFKRKIVLADTGYFSEENLRILDLAGANAFVPDNHFRTRDPQMPHRQAHHKPSARAAYRKNHFIFNEATNTYTCPEGKILKHETSRTVKGHVGHGYEANRQDCMVCHAREHCLKKGSTRRTVFKVDAFTTEKRQSFSHKMIEKIDTIH